MTTDSVTYLITLLSICLSATYQLILLICESDTADRIPVISTAEHLHTLESLDELID